MSDEVKIELTTLDMAIGLLKMAVCPNCDGSGATQTQSRQVVTHDMSSDAGCQEMEGSLYCDDEWEQCQWCDEKQQVLAAYETQKEGPK